MTQPETTDDAPSKFAPRTVTKFVANALVAAKVSSIAKNVITNRTQYSSDSIVVIAGSNLVGYYVAGMLEPVTDKVVDTTIDFTTKHVSNFKTKRQVKKAAKNATKQD